MRAQAPVLAARRPTRKIRVGSLNVGGDAPITVQSMTTTKTHDIGATLQQIAELTAAGCDIVRVACPTDKDAEALPIIAKQSRIPVIADIHFNPKYVFAAIEAGCGAVRVNPGNIRKFDDQVADICKAASDAGVSLRIGVNAGSLDKRLLKKYGKATPEALVESATWEAGLFEENDFHDFKISVKHHDVVTMVQAYRLLSEAGQWPLHLGVTEAGPAFQGTIKSCAAFGTLLAEGIGDTIRVSLSAPPVEEVKVGTKLLEFMGLRERQLEIVSSRSSPAPPAAGPRWTCGPLPRRWRRDSRRSPLRCAWPSWAASSTAPARPARRIWAAPRAMVRARSSCAARSWRPSRRTRSSRPSSSTPRRWPPRWPRSSGRRPWPAPAPWSPQPAEDR